jgi:hypothetical protein
MPIQRTRFADIIRAEYPNARNRYFQDMAQRQQQSGIDLQRNALAQSAEQARQQLELQRQQAEDQQQQQSIANGISGLALAKTAYPYAKSGVQGAMNLFQSPDTGVYEAAGYNEPAVQYGSDPALNSLYSPEMSGAGEAASTSFAPAVGYEAPTFAASSEVAPYAYNPVTESIFAESAAPAYGAGEAAIPTAAEGAAGYGAGYGAGSGAGEGAGAAAGGGLSWWGGPVIAAATFGQLKAAESSDPVEGVAPGHFFSQNESGNWRPRFAEPDKNYFSQQWGGGPTTGARFDARLQKGDWQGAGKALPGFIHGYGIPGLDAFGNVVGGYAERQGGERLGKAAQSLVDPVGTLTGSLAESKDIGDAAATILSGGIVNDSHFCTLIDKKIGTTRKEKFMLMAFKNWSEKNRPELTKYYEENMGKVAFIIDQTMGDNIEFYAVMKDMLIDRVIAHVQNEDMEAAFNQYFEGGMKLIREFSPEHEPFISKAEMPVDNG